MRQLVLDTETTGLKPEDGERLIEIAILEMVDRKLTGNNLHLYFNPEKEVHPRAAEVHGWTLEKLKHFSPFSDEATTILSFLRDDEIIIHNAQFDMNFLKHEFKWEAERLFKEMGELEPDPFVDSYQAHVDYKYALYLKAEQALALQKFNNPVFCTLKYCRHRDKVGQFERGYKLEQQCEKFGIQDNREKHSAIEDAKMLAELYLKLTEPFVGFY